MSRDTEHIEQRKNNARTSHKLFEKAFIAANCPPGFKYQYDHEQKKGKRIMTLEDRKKDLAEAELPPVTRKRLYASRMEEYMVKKQRERIKNEP